jgi:hypothetical protein
MLKRVYFTSLDSNECLICKTCEKNDDCFKNTAIFDNEINEWICNIEDACYKVDHCSTCDIDLECKLCKENTAKFKNKVYNYDRYY